MQQTYYMTYVYTRYVARSGGIYIYLCIKVGVQWHSRFRHCDACKNFALRSPTSTHHHHRIAVPTRTSVRFDFVGRYLRIIVYKVKNFTTRFLADAIDLSFVRRQHLTVAARTQRRRSFVIFSPSNSLFIRDTQIAHVEMDRRWPKSTVHYYCLERISDPELRIKPQAKLVVERCVGLLKYLHSSPANEEQ